MRASLRLFMRQTSAFCYGYMTAPDPDVDCYLVRTEPQLSGIKVNAKSSYLDLRSTTIQTTIDEFFFIGILESLISDPTPRGVECLLQRAKRNRLKSGFWLVIPTCPNTHLRLALQWHSPSRNFRRFERHFKQGSRLIDRILNILTRPIVTHILGRHG
jgi:hypothetical protein